MRKMATVFRLPQASHIMIEKSNVLTNPADETLFRLPCSFYHGWTTILRCMGK